LIIRTIGLDPSEAVWTDGPSDVSRLDRSGAAAILVAVPIAFVFNLFLDRFISGFTMGAVKG
jgi:ABC-type maltose transport system permease subunit